MMDVGGAARTRPILAGLERKVRHRCHEGGVLPYITYIGMCGCEGYGVQAVWSGIGYRNQGALI